MEILIITTRLYPDSGGPAVFAYRLGVKMAKAGYQVHFLTAFPPKNGSPIKDIENKIIFHYLPIYAPVVEKKLRIIRNFIFLIRFIVVGLFSAISITKKTKIQIIHAQSPYPAGIIALFLQKIKHIPFTYLSHSLEYGGEPSSKLIDIYLIHKNANYSFLIAQYISKFLPKNRPWQLMVNAVDSARFHKIRLQTSKAQIIKDLNLQSLLGSDDFIILYIAYMVYLAKARGMIDFARGFQMMLESIPPEQRSRCKLLFVGDGTYKYLLDSVIRKNSLSKNVFLLGKRREIPQLCAISNVGALTSHDEAMPTTLLEMMASGIPCIGTKVGEIPNIIADTGFLIEPGKVKEIMIALRKLYDSPDLTKKLGEQAQIRIRNFFSWDVVLQKYYTATKRILNITQ